jgi:hypothetical protein
MNKRDIFGLHVLSKGLESLCPFLDSNDCKKPYSCRECTDGDYSSCPKYQKIMEIHT